MIQSLKLTSIVLLTLTAASISFAATAPLVVICQDENNSIIEIERTETREGDSRISSFYVVRIENEKSELIGSDLQKDEETRLLPKTDADEEAPTENVLTFSIEGCGLYVEISKEKKSGFYRTEDQKEVKISSCQISSKL